MAVFYSGPANHRLKVARPHGNRNGVLGIGSSSNGSVDADNLAFNKPSRKVADMGLAASQFLPHAFGGRSGRQVCPHWNTGIHELTTRSILHHDPCVFAPKCTACLLVDRGPLLLLGRPGA